jgi:RES domain-containing protein
MDLWRISNHVSLNGEGGRRAPARWHSGGQPIIYLAASPPGALIEILAHLEIREGMLPDFYTLLQISVPEALRPIDLHLSKDGIWKHDEVLTRQLGDTWLASQQSALARVPSAIMPSTFNYLLNPNHPDAPKITIEASQNAVYDLRLMRTRPNRKHRS